MYCTYRATDVPTQDNVSLSALLGALYGHTDMQVDMATSFTDIFNLLKVPSPIQPTISETSPKAVVLPLTPTPNLFEFTPTLSPIPSTPPIPFPDPPTTVTAVDGENVPPPPPPFTSMSNHFDHIMTQWTSEITHIEGKYRQHLFVRDESFKIIDGLLQSGLISSQEHENLKYVNTLFMRLCDLHRVDVRFNRREIIYILLELYELGKFSKATFLDLCVNI